MKRSSKRIVALLLAVPLLLLPGLAESAPPVTDLPSGLVARDPFAWDKTLTISAPESIDRYKKHQGVVLVDVRSVNEWSLARIPGAMHIPLAFVPTKAFLKGRPFVLVGSGHDSVELLKACRDMQSRGFKGRVLAGGIQAWLTADGPLEGNPAALLPMREMRPEAFFQEKNIGDRLVLYVSADGTSNVAQAILPYALPISLEVNTTQLKHTIDAARQPHGAAVDLPLLVCTPDGQGHDRIAARLAQADVTPVLFLEGGLAAYRTYLSGILQARRPKADRIKTVGGCQGCGPVDGVEKISDDQN